MGIKRIITDLKTKTIRFLKSNSLFLFFITIGVGLYYLQVKYQGFFSNIKEISTPLAAIVASYVALEGLDAWREKLKVESRHNLAGEFLDKATDLVIKTQWVLNNLHDGYYFSRTFVGYRDSFRDYFYYREKCSAYFPREDLEQAYELSKKMDVVEDLIKELNLNQRGSEGTVVLSKEDLLKVKRALGDDREIFYNDMCRLHEDLKKNLFKRLV